MDTIFVSAPTRARLEKIGSRCEKKRETDDIFVVCTGGQRVQYFYQGLARGGRKATRVEPAEGCVCGGVGCQGAPTIEGFEWGATPRPLSIGCLFTHLFPFVLLSLSASSRAFFVLGHPDARVPSGPRMPGSPADPGCQTRHGSSFYPGPLPGSAGVPGKIGPGAHNLFGSHSFRAGSCIVTCYKLITTLA